MAVAQAASRRAHSRAVKQRRGGQTSIRGTRQHPRRQAAAAPCWPPVACHLLHLVAREWVPSRWACLGRRLASTPAHPACWPRGAPICLRLAPGAASGCSCSQRWASGRAPGPHPDRCHSICELHVPVLIACVCDLSLSPAICYCGLAAIVGSMYCGLGGGQSAIQALSFRVRCPVLPSRCEAYICNDVIFSVFSLFFFFGLLFSLRFFFFLIYLT